MSFYQKSGQEPDFPADIRQFLLQNPQAEDSKGCMQTRTFVICCRFCSLEIFCLVVAAAFPSWCKRNILGLSVVFALSSGNLTRKTPRGSYWCRSESKETACVERAVYKLWEVSSVNEKFGECAFASTCSASCFDLARTHLRFWLQLVSAQIIQWPLKNWC